MHLFDELTKTAREEKMCKRMKHLCLPLFIGVAAGAIATLLIVPKSKDIRMTFEKTGEKLTDTAEAGQNKMSELIQEGEKKFEDLKDDMRQHLT